MAAEKTVVQDAPTKKREEAWRVNLDAQGYKSVKVRTNPAKVTPDAGDGSEATYYDAEQRVGIGATPIEVLRTPAVTQWLKSDQLLED